MKLALILIVVLLVVAAYVFRDKWLPLLKKVGVKPADPVKAQDPVQPAPQAAQPVIQKPDGSVSAPNNPILDAYIHSNPQYHDTAGGEDAPRIDTSAPALDFAKVGNGVPIPLEANQAKKITGCPAKVRVSVFYDIQTGQANTNYTVTINGNPQPGTILAEQQYPADGPEVTVSIDSPGMQFEIHGA